MKGKRPRIRAALKGGNSFEIKKDKLKTPEQIHTEIEERYLSNSFVPKQAMFEMVKSGDVILDFSNFTLKQSGNLANGYKSYDDKDPYVTTNIAKGIDPYPPLADTDGRKPHTVKDITYLTFASIVSHDSARFYTMNDIDRKLVIVHFITPSFITKSNAVNGFLAYMYWSAPVVFNKIRGTYDEWYGNLIEQDTKIDNERIILERLVDIRLWQIACNPKSKEYPGWAAGILNLWHLLIQYT
jgi:hypothetical protein